MEWPRRISEHGINGIYQFQTGFPITILRSGDPLGVGTNGAVRPDQVCDPNLPRGDRTIRRFFASECFVATADRFGTAGRSTVIGPDINVLDLAVFKTIAVRDDVRVQLRGELFNALNHLNWNQPGRNLG